jgi:hypothetical protein
MFASRHELAIVVPGEFFVIVEQTAHGSNRGPFLC